MFFSSGRASLEKTHRHELLTRDLIYHKKKRMSIILILIVLFRGEDRARTDDLLTASQAL